MKKLAVLLALFCFTAAMSQAATTIVLTHSGTPTTYGDLHSALVAMAAGDTLDIQDFDGPLLMGPMNSTSPTVPSWSTVMCSKAPAGTQATILIPSGNGGNNYWGALDHSTLTNLIIDGQCVGDTHNAPDGNPGPAVIANGGDVSTVTNCTFKGAWWNTLMPVNGGMSGGVQEAGTTFTNCYIEGYGTCIAFSDGFVSAPATLPDKAIFNHCTIVNRGSGFIMNIDSNFNGKSTKDVFSIRNSILSARGAAVGIVWAGSGPATDTSADVDEDYNLFDAWWNQIYSQGGGASGPPVGAHSINYDYRSNPEIFRNFAGGDFRLGGTGAFGNWVPGGNIAVGKASDGGNIGADLLTVPVELSNFSAE